MNKLIGTSPVIPGKEFLKRAVEHTRFGRSTLELFLGSTRIENLATCKELFEQLEKEGLEVWVNDNEAQPNFSDTLFLKLKDKKKIVLSPRLFETLMHLSPDECNVKGDWIRLWWD